MLKQVSSWILVFLRYGVFSKSLLSCVASLVFFSANESLCDQGLTLLICFAQCGLYQVVKKKQFPEEHSHETEHKTNSDCVILSKVKCCS